MSEPHSRSAPPYELCPQPVRQASRARKCPGAAAWTPPQRKNATKRNQSLHPWASAHGSPDCHQRTHVTQASRVRKCPGAAARMPPNRKYDTKRYHTQHPWAPAHGSPGCRQRTHVTHGEPGTEVPGCRGTDAATTQKHHKTQSSVDLSSSHFDVPEGTRLVTRFATFPVASFFRQ